MTFQEQWPWKWQNIVYLDSLQRNLQRYLLHGRQNRLFSIGQRDKFTSLKVLLDFCDLGFIILNKSYLLGNLESLKSYPSMILKMSFMILENGI